MLVVYFLFVGLFLSNSLSSTVIDEEDDDGSIGDSIISTDELLNALKIGRQYVEDMERIEADIKAMNRNKAKANGGKPKRRFHYNRHSAESVAQSKEAAVELMARKHLSEKFGVPADQISFDEVAEHLSHNRKKRATVCSGQFASLTGSRTFDGTCNNLNFTDYGKSHTIHSRLLPPVFQDGVGVPRSGPSPRAITNAVLQNESLPNYGNTLIVMQFGQFLDHDMSLTNPFTMDDGSEFNCCSGNNSIYGDVLAPAPHPECFPIMLPPNDPYYGPNNCMTFVRSTYGKNLDGSTPPFRQGINVLTPWNDASNVYGSDNEFAASLRNTSAGRGLMATSQGARNLLPVVPGCCPDDPTNSCPAAQYCFVAGDSRVNEHPYLTVMHTLWMREHNRIANFLYNQNPALSDEAIFQLARKILIAEWQHIIYTEWLPIVIGPTLATAVYNGTYGPIYNPLPNPALFSEFFSAALRMGHSLIKSYMRIIDKDGGVNLTMSYFVADAFDTGKAGRTGAFRLLDPNFIDGALRGMLLTPVQKIDHCFAEDLTHQLLRTPGKGNLGFDLISRNIQRARDHGIPPYYRYWNNPKFATVNPNPPINFNSLSSTHSQEIISYLKRAYTSVTDIDLYIGAITENTLSDGALLGPTFANIIAKQFDNLKQADRFFYNIAVKDGDKVPPFTAAQLAEIKKVTFSRIICDNNDKSITTIQPKAFVAADLPTNLPVACSTIPSVDLTLWK